MSTGRGPREDLYWERELLVAWCRGRGQGATKFMFFDIIRVLQWWRGWVGIKGVVD